MGLITKERAGMESGTLFLKRTRLNLILIEPSPY